MKRVKPEALFQIVEQAAPLAERLEIKAHEQTAEAGSSLSAARLARWQELAAKDDQTRFHKRFEWNGLSLEDARRTLESIYPVSTLPVWAVILAEVIEAAPDFMTCLDDLSGFDYIQPADPLPFEEIFAPFVEVAGRRLQTSAGSRLALLAGQAQDQLKRFLLQILAKHGSQAALVDFMVYRNLHDVSSIYRANPEAHPQRKHYLNYARHFLSDGIVPFFRQYSVLARMLGTAIELWLESVIELLDRLQNDRGEIADVFNLGVAVGQVTSIKTGLSDPHNRGRTIARLTFSSGLNLIYKPRPAGLEQAFNRTLEWFNRQALPLKFRTVRTVCRPDYGWMEFVEYAPGSDREAVRRYYRRLGYLVGLLQVLETTDCHFENLIASSEYPVLIDCETILHPRAPDPAGHNLNASEADLAYNHLIEHSALRTALLPYRYSHEKGAYHFSALAARPEVEIPFQIPEWQNINTDRMKLIYTSARLEPVFNVPADKNSPFNFNDYLDDLLEGYSTIYRFMIANRQELLADGGPLEGFKGLPARFIFRDTEIYGALSARLAHPKHLRTGLDRGIELEVLSRAYLYETERPPYWPLLKAELKALEQGDIPVFHVKTDCATVLSPAGTEVERWLPATAVELATRNIEVMSEAGLEREIDIIRAAISDFLDTEGSLKATAWWKPFITGS